MGNIDFSKVPRGATHMVDGDFKKVKFYKVGNGEWYYYSYSSDGWCKSGNYDEWFTRNLKEIPKQKMLIEFKTEREVMLCEQVLRMCRGEPSQFKGNNGEWLDTGVFDGVVSIDETYRAKPKKELVVPWEFIADCIKIIRVADDGNVYGHKDESDTCGTVTHIKLDLTDIELPIIVKRPSEK